MPSDPYDDRPGGSPWLLILLALTILIVIGLSVTGMWLWRRYDPFILNRPSVRDAKALMDVARQRPLADEEFESVIRHLRSDTAIAQLSALATIELEAGRSPERKTRAIEALTDALPNADATVRPSFERVLGRVKGE